MSMVPAVTIWLEYSPLQVFDYTCHSNEKSTAHCAGDQILWPLYSQLMSFVVHTATEATKQANGTSLAHCLADLFPKLFRLLFPELRREA